MVYYLPSTRKIGPRSHVWSEKEVVDKAAWEFEEVSQLPLIQVTPGCGGHRYTAFLYRAVRLELCMIGKH